jgi:hypothetical protein
MQIDPKITHLIEKVNSFFIAHAKKLFFNNGRKIFKLYIHRNKQMGKSRLEVASSTIVNN